MKPSSSGNEACLVLAWSYLFYSRGGYASNQLGNLVPEQGQHCQGASSLFIRKTLFLTTSLQERHRYMEHRQSPLDNNENKHRQNSAEKPSDASPSERLQKSRNSHLIGRGINPRDGLGQQVSTDEAREKNAITTPSETASNSRDNGTGQRSLDLSSRWSQDVYSESPKYPGQK